MKLRLTILSFICTVFAQAQQFELGKVSKAELEQKTHPTEPDAPAAILYENGTTYMDFDERNGFTLVTETDVRIKIYTKEGYSWANKSVPYYIALNPKENVSFSKAVTYNLVNGAIEKTKLKSEGEFDEQVNKFWARKKITMPNVKEGSVIEYRYVVTSPYTSSFPTWNFQNTIPVNFSTFVTKIPEYYTFKTNFRGSIFPTQQQTSQHKTYNYVSKEHTTNSYNVTSTSFNSGSFEYNEFITTYTARDMPSMKDENYVSNIKNYMSSIEHELSAVKYPNSPVKNYSTTWDDVVKTIYDSEDFGGELKKTGYFEDDIPALIAGMNGNAEKAAAIFNYVKQRMHWNEFTGYRCDDGVRKAYKDKVGNIAEINLMLTAMLRFAGITANPVLVSTRDNGVAIFPNRTAFNYVVCAVEDKNNIILLDATDKYSLPDILPVRALNWVGRLVRENGSSEQVDLMPKNNSKDVVTVLATLDNTGKLSGKIRDQYFDYNAFLYRVRNSGLAKDAYLEKLEKKLNGIEVDQYTAVSDDFSKPVTESYAFSHNAASEIIGDKIYLDPLLFFTQKENPFKQDKREYPVDFVFPNQDKYMLTITLPDGYAVETMPAPTSVEMLENLGSFRFNITNSGKQIQIAATIDINQAVIGAEDYETLKSFYKAIIDKENEKIVLKKI